VPRGVVDGEFVGLEQRVALESQEIRRDPLLHEAEVGAAYAVQIGKVQTAGDVNGFPESSGASARFRKKVMGVPVSNMNTPGVPFTLASTRMYPFVSLNGSSTRPLVGTKGSRIERSLDVFMSGAEGARWQRAPVTASRLAAMPMAPALNRRCMSDPYYAARRRTSRFADDSPARTRSRQAEKRWEADEKTVAMMPPCGRVCPFQ